MSLERYCHERCIALSPRDSAYVAARAMAANQVGAIVVYARGRVVGIVTDRDLALRVVGGGRDPDVALGEVMTGLAATLSIDDDPEDAIELMRDLGVRRIPVLEGERLVGMVTLDDLLLTRDVSPARLAAVVEAQLAEPASAKPGGFTHRVRRWRGPGGGAPRMERRAARADQTFRRFVLRLCEALDVEDRDVALRAFGVVAEGLVRRLTPSEADDFLAQLPLRVRDRLLDLPCGPDRSITRAAIEHEMARTLNLDHDQASRMVDRVGDALAEVVSVGELRQVRGQLPLDLKPLLGRAERAQA